MNPDETTPPVDNLIDAVQQHHWPVAVGLGIALAIYAANRANLLKKVPSRYTPAVAAVLGIVSAIGAQLATGMGWEEALGKGFLAGAAATGFWEMALKHVLKFPVETPVPAEAPKAEAPKAEVPAAESSPKPAKAPKAPKAKKESPAPVAEEAPVESPPVEAVKTESAPVETPVEPAVAAPKKRGRPRKNPEA